MEQRRARNWLAVGVAMLCVAVLCLGGFRLLQERALDTEREAFEAKYRALGYPVTLEELQEAHEVPAGAENAAFMLLAALDRIDDSDVDYDYIPLMGANPELPPPGEPLPAKMASEIQYFLSLNEEPINTLRRLIHEPYCNFPIDWDNFMGMSLDRLARMRNLARIFSLRALVLGDGGDIDGAIDAIEDIFLVGNIDMRQPLLISYLVGTGISGIGTSSVQLLLESSTLNDDQLLRLAGIIESAKSREDPLYPLLGDYIRGEHWIENMRAIAPIERTGDPLSLVVDSVYNLTGLEAHDTRAYRQLIDVYLELYTMPLGEALEQLETVETPFFFSLFPKGMMREYGTIGTERVIKLFARYQILYDAILTTLHVERYRLQEGVLPTSLGDLVPKYLEEVPLDPYGGAALRYRAVGQSYVVYSVGSDGIDQGGYDFEADEALSPRKEIGFVVRRGPQQKSGLAASADTTP